jgi:hypothetical protein
VSVDVHDGKDLSQADQGQAHGAVVVKEGQPVLAGAGGEDDADAEAEEAGDAYKTGSGDQLSEVAGGRFVSETTSGTTLMSASLSVHVCM